MAKPNEFVGQDGLEFLIEKLVRKIKANSGTGGGSSSNNEIMLMLVAIMGKQKLIDQMQNTKIVFLAKEVKRLQRRIANCTGCSEIPDPPPRPPTPPGGGDNCDHGPDCTCSVCCKPMTLEDIERIFDGVLARIEAERNGG